MKESNNLDVLLYQLLKDKSNEKIIEVLEVINNYIKISKI